ncbi:hypothetical protein BMETH_854_0 [methanotrophic bacterial endosymbiont of Bathymodiolus sp.]|nr:hypothetical protein BMETH_854_0 [methanotrophic bacterial endosymbiont of Bathymodiolus sp.]
MQLIQLVEESTILTAIKQVGTAAEKFTLNKNLREGVPAGFIA